jgi:hypothetical protein
LLLNAYSQGFCGEYPPTELEKIGNKMDSLIETVYKIDKNVALGQQDISSFTTAFAEEKIKTEKLETRTENIEKDMIVVEGNTTNNTNAINTINKIVWALVCISGTAIAGYLKAKATKKNNKELKRMADMQEKLIKKEKEIKA